jgi:AcrR family transcriptional regulator
VREQAAQDTRDAILKAATRIFAKHGYSGGRIDEISKAARSYDRMIYYYFGSKEALFIAVLEDMYRRFNEAETALELEQRTAGGGAHRRHHLHVDRSTSATPSSSRC